MKVASGVERVETAESERALAIAAKELAAELRLTDVLDLITFIRTDNHANLNDLVNSSAELYFKPGTIAYGWGADVSLGWAGSPTVSLNLEFRHQEMTAFFDLILGPSKAGIALRHLAHDGSASTPSESAQRLTAAIADARLPARSFADLS